MYTSRIVLSHLLFTPASVNNESSSNYFGAIRRFRILAVWSHHIAVLANNREQGDSRKKACECSALQHGKTRSAWKTTPTATAAVAVAD